MGAAKMKGSASTELIHEVSQMVMKITGVQLGERQAHMVENRIKKRFLQLKMTSEAEYLEYMRKNRDSEAQALISLLTTHHTYFFREFSHFEYLERAILPALIEKRKAQKLIRVWSAACSRGQEVYSLSMFLNHVLSRIAPDFKFEIVGSDVDPESVRIASNGVYHRREVQEIPLHFLSGGWAKGTGEIVDYVKALPKIKSNCRFEVGNLLTVKDTAPKAAYDIIFCRNVFIYFTPQQIKTISEGLLGSLKQDGYLFLGISENLNGLGLGIETAGPSIYRHLGASATVEKQTIKATTAPSIKITAKKLRVVCVDDSPVILSLLKKVLASEHNFEIVGTAANGIEAAKKIQELKPDVVTLDIHMPEQNGLEYLKSQMKKGHPPVVMISSVSREDADLAFKCLEAGAVDYVEKPELSNLSERADEIRAKLRFAESLSGDKRDLNLEKSFSKEAGTIADPEKKLRVVLASLSDRDRLRNFLRDLPEGQPPTVLLIEGAGAGLLALNKALTGKIGSKTIQAPEDIKTASFKKDHVYLGEMKDFFSKYKSANYIATSIIAFSPVSEKMAKSVQTWGAKHVLVEDRGASHELDNLRKCATDIIPITGFSYHAHQHFIEKK